MPRNASYYKPFKLKYVLCHVIGDGPEVSTWTEDNKGNRIPVFFDTKIDAVQEIIYHAECIVDAIKRGDYTEDRLEDCFTDFVCEASLTKAGHLLIQTIPDEHENYDTIFDGKISGIVN